MTGHVVSRSLPTQRASFYPPLPSPSIGAGIQDYPHTRMSAMGTLAGDILKDSVFYIDALDHQLAGANPKTVRNLGTVGTALDARCGSTSVADSNDPKFLDYQGSAYVYLPGVSGNYLSVPDNASYRLSGDCTLDIKASYDSLSNAWAICRYGASGNRSYTFGISGGGTPFFTYTTDGTTDVQINATTTASNLTDGTVQWFRMVFQANNGSAQNVTKFYTSVDDVTWTQLGSTVTNAGAVTIFAGTNPLEIGARTGATAGYATAKIYRARIYSDITQTTKVLDIDTSVLSSGSSTSFVEKSSNAATVTINRSTSGRKSVAVVAPVWLLGTDDYIRVANHNALNFSGTDSFSILVVGRQFATFNTSGTWLSKSIGSSASNAGFVVTNGFGTPSQLSMQLSDGIQTGLGTAQTKTAGILQVFTGVRNRQLKTIQNFLNGVGTAANTNDPTQSIIGNSYRLLVGKLEDPNFNANDFEVMAVAIFRRALSASEISTLSTYFSGKWA